MRLTKETGDVFRVFNAWRKFEWILALLNLISGWFGISVVGFLRKDFGERYFGWLNLFWGYTIVVNLAFLGNLLGAAAWQQILLADGFVLAGFRGGQSLPSA